jgi:hypothetical protein
MKPRDIADILGPALVQEVNGFLARRGFRRISGSEAEKFNYFLQGAVMDGLTKPYEPRVVDVAGKIVRKPSDTQRS